MKTFRLPILILALIFSSIGVEAQKFISSIEAGPNIYRMTDKSPFMLGGEIGYRVDFLFRDKPSGWYLTSGLSFVLDRTKADMTVFDNGKEIESEANLYQLSIPLKVGYRKYFSPNWSGFAGLGTGVKIGLFGKGKNVFYATKTAPEGQWGYETTGVYKDFSNVFSGDVFKRVCWSLVRIEAGAEYKSHYRFSLQYTIDRLNSKPDGFAFDGTGLRQGITFMFGYRF